MSAWELKSLAWMTTSIMLACIIASCLQPKTVKLGAPRTPLQTVAAWNDLLAAGNYSVNQTAIRLNTAGFFDQEGTHKILEITGRIDSLGLKVTAVIEKAAGSQPAGALDVSTAVQLKDLFSQIFTVAQLAVNDGSLWVKNPNSRAELSLLLQSLADTAKLVMDGVTSLQAKTPAALPRPALPQPFGARADPVPIGLIT